MGWGEIRDERGKFMGGQDDEEDRRHEHYAKQLYEQGVDVSFLPPEQRARYLLEDAIVQLRVGNIEIGRRKVVRALKLLEEVE